MKRSIFSQFQEELRPSAHQRGWNFIKASRLFLSSLRGFAHKQNLVHTGVVKLPNIGYGRLMVGFDLFYFCTDSSETTHTYRCARYKWRHLQLVPLKPLNLSKPFQLCSLSGLSSLNRRLNRFPWIAVNLKALQVFASCATSVRASGFNAQNTHIHRHSKTKLFPPGFPSPL